MPSATWHSLPDVSLYDHSAATAAITQAILGCPAGQEKFLLFGGDLSGIQAFIFGREEPTDRGAARLLRARSFLLQAVTRSIWLALLKRLELDPVAKIMEAGGRFVLLLPNTPAICHHLDNLESEVESWLLENFQGAVRLNFARLELVEGDLGKDKFAAKFDQFNEALEEAKLHPFSHSVAAGKLPVLPTVYADYGKFGECAFCHTRPATGEEDDQPVCGQCRQLKKLGNALPRARFVAFTTSRQSGPDVFANLLFDDVSLHFYENMPPDTDARHALQILSVRNEPIFTAAPIAGHIPRITERDLRRWDEEGRLSHTDAVPTFMGEKCEAGSPKTFAILAQESRFPPGRPSSHWESVACLGICKADVDNLGLIFSMGFGQNFSLSCYAMLARMLNHFFAGYLMQVIRKEFPNIYVVFAGGDDVFVIGPWSETIAFGLRMAHDFRKFCGDNPAVTISAGIPLVKPGLPMRGMREEAEAWLETSKHYSGDTNGQCPDRSQGCAGDSKNAVTIFGVSAHWRKAAQLLEDGHWLASLCGEGVITRGFLRRLLDYARECREFIQGKKLAQNGLYLAHFNYDLARNWEGGASDDLVRLQNLVNNTQLFAKMEMGISWAIYRTRTSS